MNSGRSLHAFSKFQAYGRAQVAKLSKLQELVKVQSKTFNNMLARHACGQKIIPCPPNGSYQLFRILEPLRAYYLGTWGARDRISAH